jgi:hypothetical protein
MFSDFKSLVCNRTFDYPSLIRHCTGQAFLMRFRDGRRANQRQHIGTPLSTVSLVPNSLKSYKLFNETTNQLLYLSKMAAEIFVIRRVHVFPSL